MRGLNWPFRRICRCRLPGRPLLGLPDFLSPAAGYHRQCAFPPGLGHWVGRCVASRSSAPRRDSSELTPPLPEHLEQVRSRNAKLCSVRDVPRVCVEDVVSDPSTESPERLKPATSRLAEFDVQLASLESAGKDPRVNGGPGMISWPPGGSPR